MKQPKFKIGDNVSMRRKTMYGETEGEITAVDREFLETYSNGSFNSRGLMQSERHIETIKLPYTFDGETLTIEHPQRDFGTFILKAVTMVYKFKSYSYVVKTPRINTLYLEGSLKKI